MSKQNRTCDGLVDTIKDKDTQIDGLHKDIANLKDKIGEMSISVRILILLYHIDMPHILLSCQKIHRDSIITKSSPPTPLRVVFVHQLISVNSWIHSQTQLTMQIGLG